MSDGGPKVDVRVDIDDPLVDGGDEAAHLGLAPGGGDTGPGVVDLPAQHQGRRVDRQVLVAELLAQPPQLVVGRARSGIGSPVPGQVVELPPVHALPDLALDPSLPADLGRLLLGHRRSSDLGVARRRRPGRIDDTGSPAGWR